MIRKSFLFFVILLLLIPAAWATMQDDDSTPVIEIAGVNASGLPTATLLVNVFDTLGLPVTGLTADDFTLSGELVDAGGQIVSVANITEDSLNFAIVLVIDVSSSMAGPPFANAQAAARAFIDSIGDDNPVAIIAFGNTVQLVTDFTTDRDVLVSAVNSLTFGGRTALYDAAAAGVALANRAPLPRRAVVLLSDGAEFGGISRAQRGDALNEARIRGIPVYTIGLGYGTDRTFLQELSGGTSAVNYESPTSDELLGIYTTLAGRLRSQYVVTIAADLPLDGQVYAFTLQATTAEGLTNVAEGTLRAPVPVPIVSLPEDLFVEPLSEPTLVTARILADDPLVQTGFTIDGEQVTTLDSYIIDPVEWTPGTHSLAFIAVDRDGESDTATADFEIAALPSEVTLNADFDSGPITDPVTISVDATGQTPPASVTFFLDGEQLLVDDEAPFEFTVIPFLLTPTNHTLTAEVTNTGGVTSSSDIAFEVAQLPPRVNVTGIESGILLEAPVDILVETDGQSPIASVTATINGEEVANITDQPVVNITLDPFTMQPGEMTLEITATDAAGTSTTAEMVFEVPAFPPQVTIRGLADGTVITESTEVSVIVESQTNVTQVSYAIDSGDAVTIDEPYTFTLDVDNLEPGTHTLLLTVANAGGRSVVEAVAFEVFIPTPVPTDTPAQVATDTPVPTEATDESTVEPTEEPTAVADVATTVPTDAPLEASPTVDTEGTETAIVQLTANAEGTTNAVGTANAQATADAQGTIDAEASAATSEVEPTATEEPIVEPTAVPDEATAEPTEDVQVDATEGTTPTPVDIVDVDAQGADAPPAQSDSTPILLIGGGLLLLLMLLYIFGRRQSDNQ